MNNRYKWLILMKDIMIWIILYMKDMNVMILINEFSINK